MNVCTSNVIQVRHLMQGKSATKVKKLCLTIAEGFIMELLSALKLKDCKKPAMTPGKQALVALLQSVAFFTDRVALVTGEEFFCEAQGDVRTFLACRCLRPSPSIKAR